MLDWRKASREMCHCRNKLNRQLRSGVQDEQLAELVVNLYEDDKLCLVQEAQETQEPRIICSLGLV